MLASFSRGEHFEIGPDKVKIRKAGERESRKAEKARKPARKPESQEGQEGRPGRKARQRESDKANKSESQECRKARKSERQESRKARNAGKPESQNARKAGKPGSWKARKSEKRKVGKRDSWKARKDNQKAGAGKPESGKAMKTSQESQECWKTGKPGKPTSRKAARNARCARNARKPESQKARKLEERRKAGKPEMPLNLLEPLCADNFVLIDFEAFFGITAWYYFRDNNQTQRSRSIVVCSERWFMKRSLLLVVQRQRCPKKCGPDLERFHILNSFNTKSKCFSGCLFTSTANALLGWWTRPATTKWKVTRTTI